MSTPYALLWSMVDFTFTSNVWRWQYQALWGSKSVEESRRRAEHLEAYYEIKVTKTWSGSRVHRSWTVSAIWQSVLTTILCVCLDYIHDLCCRWANCSQNVDDQVGHNHGCHRLHPCTRWCSKLRRSTADTSQINTLVQYWDELPEIYREIMIQKLAENGVKRSL